jgi:hypothetical protein
MSDYSLVEFQALRLRVGEIYYASMLDDSFVFGTTAGKVFDLDDAYNEYLTDIPVGEHRKVTHHPFLNVPSPDAIDTETADINDRWRSCSSTIDELHCSKENDPLVEVKKEFVAVHKINHIVDGTLADNQYGSMVSPIDGEIDAVGDSDTFIEHAQEDLVQESLKLLGSKHVAAQFIALYEFECSGGGEDYEAYVDLVGFPSLADIALMLRYSTQRTKALDALRDKVAQFKLDKYGRYW